MSRPSGAPCFFLSIRWEEGVLSAQFRRLAQELADRGARVVLLVTNRKRAVESTEGNPIVRVWPTGRPTHPRDALFLAKLTREHRPDCLIGNFSAVNLMMLTGWLFRVPQRLAWFHTLSQQQEIDARDQGKSELQLRLLRFRKRLVLMTATRVIGVSAAACQDAQCAYAVPSRKCLVWPNAVPDPIGPGEDPPAVQARKTILCVGRLIESKGQDVLIAAYARLDPALREQFPLCLVGGGPAQERLEQMAAQLGVQDRCTFTGEIAHTMVTPQIARAAVLVAPSRSEAFGLVAVEGLAAGTPVVASAAGGLAEIVQEGGGGILVPPGDIDALAKSLTTLLKDPALRASLGRKGRRRFLETYEQTAVAQRQAAALLALVRGQTISELS